MSLPSSSAGFGPLYNDRYQSNRNEREAVLICCYHKHASPYERPIQAPTLVKRLRSVLLYAECASSHQWRAMGDDSSYREGRRERMAAAADRLRTCLRNLESVEAMA